MEDPVRDFLRKAGVAKYEKEFEKIGMTQLEHLDGLEPADLDESSSAADCVLCLDVCCDWMNSAQTSAIAQI